MNPGYSSFFHPTCHTGGASDTKSPKEVEYVAIKRRGFRDALGEVPPSIAESKRANGSCVSCARGICINLRVCLKIYMMTRIYINGIALCTKRHNVSFHSVNNPCQMGQSVSRTSLLVSPSDKKCFIEMPRR